MCLDVSLSKFNFHRVSVSISYRFFFSMSSSWRLFGESASHSVFFLKTEDEMKTLRCAGCWFSWANCWKLKRLKSDKFLVCSRTTSVENSLRSALSLYPLPLITQIASHNIIFQVITRSQILYKWFIRYHALCSPFMGLTAGKIFNRWRYKRCCQKHSRNKLARKFVMLSVFFVSENYW